MNKSIFRQSSIDRLKSPEQLNEYIRVANPRVWLVLAAVVLLLVGVVIWGVFGYVESAVETGVLAEGGSAVCYVSETDAQKLSAGFPVMVQGVAGTAQTVSGRPVQTAGIDPYLLHLGGLTGEGFCVEVTLDLPGLPDGAYPAAITLERIHPITFVIQ